MWDSFLRTSKLSFPCVENHVTHRPLLFCRLEKGYTEAQFLFHITLEAVTMFSVFLPPGKNYSFPSSMIFHGQAVTETATDTNCVWQCQSERVSCWRGEFALCLLDEEDAGDQEVGRGQRDTWSLGPCAGTATPPRHLH